MSNKEIKKAEPNTIYHTDDADIIFLSIFDAAMVIASTNEVDFSENDIDEWKEGDSVEHWNGTTFNWINSVSHDMKLLRIAHYGGGYALHATTQDLHSIPISKVLRTFLLDGGYTFDEIIGFMVYGAYDDMVLRIAYLLHSFLVDSYFADNTKYVCIELSDSVRNILCTMGIIEN